MHAQQYGANNTMETQTEFKDIEPSFNPISFSPLSVGTQITDSVLDFNVGDKETIRDQLNFKL